MRWRLFSRDKTKDPQLAAEDAVARDIWDASADNKSNAIFNKLVSNPLIVDRLSQFLELNDLLRLQLTSKGMAQNPVILQAIKDIFKRTPYIQNMDIHAAQTSYLRTGLGHVLYSGNGFFESTPKTMAFAGIKNPKVTWIADTTNQIDYNGLEHYAIIDGNLYSWGMDNTRGQLGRCGIVSTPLKVDFKDDKMRVNRVFTVAQFVFAITTAGNVFAWGANGHWQLGFEHNKDLYAPHQLTLKDSLGLKIKDIVIGHNTIFLVSTEGNLFAWWGPDTVYRQAHATPTKLKLDKDDKVKVSQMFCHADSYFACTTDGDILSWGLNEKGQLGNGNTIDQINPEKIKFYNHDQRAIEAKFSPNHFFCTTSSDHEMRYLFFAVSNSGQLFSWGENEKGELGRKGNPNIPTQVKFVGHDDIAIDQLYVESSSMYALSTKGLVFYWGKKSDTDHEDTLNTPQKVAFEDQHSITIAQLCIGDHSVYALSKSGVLFSWRIVDDLTDDHPFPKQAVFAGHEDVAITQVFFRENNFYAVSTENILFSINEHDTIRGDSKLNEMHQMENYRRFFNSVGKHQVEIPKDCEDQEASEVISPTLTLK